VRHECSVQHAHGVVVDAQREVPHGGVVVGQCRRDLGEVWDHGRGEGEEERVNKVGVVEDVEEKIVLQGLKCWEQQEG
jgi:hypothetical protein